MKKKKIIEVVDNELSTLIEYVNSADDLTSSGRDLSDKCRRYYDGDQLTPEERKKLVASRQAPVVVNRCKPKMDGLMGMEKSNRTTVKTFARTPKHEKAATASTESIRYVLQDNFYHQIRSSAWENALIEGTMGVEVVIEPKDTDNRITIRHLMWDRLIYDPHSRRKDFSDSRYLGQVVWMDYSDAVEKYPESKDILESMQTGSSTYDDQPRWMDNTRRRVKIVELYYKKPDGDIWYSCFTRGGFCEKPKKSPFINEEGETEWPYEFASLFVMRDGGRYGAMAQYLDVQDEINKRRSKALHLMSVRQVRWERGAVEDINKARRELAKPDGVLETTPGMEFEILKTGDMAQAQFNLLSEAKLEIDAVGYNAAASGKDTRDMSGVALRTREMSAQTELGPMFDVLRHLDIRVYRKIWNRIRQYWKAEKWIRITDDENNLKWVGLNKPVTKGEQLLQQAQEQGASPQILQQLQLRNEADSLMKEIVSTENELAELDMDIIIADAPDAVTTQVEDFQVLGEMVKSGFQMPPIAVIEASPLSNKDKLIRMMKESPQIPPQAQKQMEQMQEGLQKAGEEVKKLSEENLMLKTDQQSEKAKIDSQREAQHEKFALESEAQKEKQRLAREAFEFDKQLQLDKANLEIDLEERKAKAAHAQQQDKIDFDKSLMVQEKGIEADTEVMPLIMEKLDKSFESMTKALEKIVDIGTRQLALTGELIQAQERPRNVSLSNVRRDSEGRPVGALVTPTLQ